MIEEAVAGKIVFEGLAIFLQQQPFAGAISRGDPVSLNHYLNFTEQVYLPSLLDRIRSEAVRDAAEFGFEQLRLAICFLRWSNVKADPPEPFDSPLVLLPVRLVKKKGVRSRKGNVQTFLSAALVDGPEVHPHLAVRGIGVTNAEDDDVTLIALDILQVLYQQTHILTVDLPFVLCLEPFSKRFVLVGQARLTSKRLRGGTGRRNVAFSLRQNLSRLPPGRAT